MTITATDVHVATIILSALSTAEYMAHCETLVVDEHCGHLPSESTVAECLAWGSEQARLRLVA